MSTGEIALPVECFLTKRKARYAGEVGLFPDSALAAEDFAPIALGAEVRASLATERHAALLKYLWALCSLVAQNGDEYRDREEAFDGLLVRARHIEAKVDPQTGEVIIKRLSTRRLDNEAMQRLVARVKYIVLTEVLPGVPDGQLADEIDRMIGGRERK
jgi:hypothetical protein